MELLLQLLGWILELLGEFLLQILGEAIAEWIGHGIAAPFRHNRPLSPVLGALGYLTFGAGAGALSLWIFPGLFIQSAGLRRVNLVLTPILAGSLMAWIGARRRVRDREVIGLESFGYGYCFAFAMAMVRFAFGH